MKINRRGLAVLIFVIPMGRGGYPEKVAEAILWLLSDKASCTTGSFIDLSGGR
ncbi:SDR family oxidoreductase [Pseudomonas juntendi]|uniref:SDR family oxidoreductase n=1 Tax=Pseudomonas juntendi TaxID=2666183 RepID=UPI00320AF40F